MVDHKDPEGIALTGQNEFPTGSLGPYFASVILNQGSIQHSNEGTHALDKKT